MIVATLTYLRKSGQTLMLHRNKKDRDYHKGKYNGVGGKLEAGESPEACAIREIREETGLEVNQLIYRGHLSFPMFDGHNDWLCFVYECHEFQGELGPCPEGTLHWIPDENLLDLPLWDGDVHFLRVLYNTPDIFFGQFVYENQQLVSYQLQTQKQF